MNLFFIFVPSSCPILDRCDSLCLSLAALFVVSLLSFSPFYQARIEHTNIFGSRDRPMRWLSVPL